MKDFTSINRPYTYGYEAKTEKVLVEVVRAYAGDWRVYAYNPDGSMIRDVAVEKLLFPVAMACARGLLRRLG